MAKHRINITVGEQAFALLSEMGNHSDYLSRVVEQRDSQWRAALLVLRGMGWRDTDLIDVIDKMAGYHPPGQPARMVVRHAIQRNLLGLPKRWEAALLELDTPEDGAEIARMICVVAAEYWVGNTILRKELGAI